jgi:P27 family predicted phage terminase small subunit
MSATKPTKAPIYLTPATRRWWETIAAEYELEPHHLKLLTAAAESWDRAQEARKILAAEGLCTTDRFGQRRAHPAAGIERDAKGLFARLLRELGLDVSTPDSRPPRVGGAKY